MFRPFALALLLSTLIACQESRDPRSADGALRLFGVALEEGDKALIKASLSEQTNKSLEEILSTLKEIEREISLFPTPEAQTWARTHSLGEDAAKFKDLKSTDSLWNALVGEKLKWAQTQSSGAVEQGLNMRRVVSGSEEEGEMTVLTRSDNKVSLRREGTRWVITSFEAPLLGFNKTLNHSLKTMPLNREEWSRRDQLDLLLPSP